MHVVDDLCDVGCAHEHPHMQNALCIWVRSMGIATMVSVIELLNFVTLLGRATPF